jgi:hypothetical protein
MVNRRGGSSQMITGSPIIKKTRPYCRTGHSRVNWWFSPVTTAHLSTNRLNGRLSCRIPCTKQVSLPEIIRCVRSYCYARNARIVRTHRNCWTIYSVVCQTINGSNPKLGFMIDQLSQDISVKVGTERYDHLGVERARQRGFHRSVQSLPADERR